jgi:hypothetical protein
VEIADENQLVSTCQLPKQMEFLDVEVEWIRILSSMMLQL